MSLASLLTGIAVMLALPAIPGRAMQQQVAFANPIATNRSDPHVIKSGGKYYLTSTDGCPGGICVWESDALTGLGSATRHKVFTIPPCPAPDCAQVWAPEIHEIGGQFYIYYSASNGQDAGHRIYALRSATPTGSYVDVGKLAGLNDFWAIDLNVFTGPDAKLYAT